MSNMNLSFLTKSFTVTYCVSIHQQKIGKPLIQKTTFTEIKELEAKKRRAIRSPKQAPHCSSFTLPISLKPQPPHKKHRLRSEERRVGKESRCKTTPTRCIQTTAGT